MDSIEIMVQAESGMFEGESVVELETVVSINGQQVKFDFIEVYDFFSDVAKKGINTAWWVKDCEKEKSFYYNEVYSTFEPFTCSCGVPGCAGIWGGIVTKHRKHSVEWRPADEMGYTFLKNYYNFNKREYYQQVVNAWDFIHELMRSGAKKERHGELVFLQEWYSDYYSYQKVAAGIDEAKRWLRDN